MWILYQVALALALLAAAPVLLARRGGHYRPTLGGRLGAAGGAALSSEERGGRPVWVHAVSVGEVGVAATLVRALPVGLPLLVTTVTPTGQERAHEALGGRAAVAYLPFDLDFAVGRFFRRWQPRALVLVEGDYWPLVLRAARRRGLPVLVVNGRVGDRSFRRMRRLRPLLGPLFRPVDRFGVQTAEDRRRLLALGVPEAKIEVTGNLKFDTAAPPASPDLDRLLGTLAGGRPLLVAGSTMAGEEEAVLDAFAGIGPDGPGQRALLVLAPRHPERCDEVERLLAGRGLRWVRRTALADGAEAVKSVTGERPAVLLLDTLGELAALYRHAAAAFIGGTLVPTGGHNPLEPARYGVRVAVGPSMDNFRDIAGLFDRAGAWRRVADAAELGEVWRRWLDDPAAGRDGGERAAELVAENRGALARTLELMAPVLALADPVLDSGR
jgi:3-deoxy-D-manno-octulosonic-acid transferase